MKTIILDTNFLLVPGQFKFDIFTGLEELMNEPFEAKVLEGTFEELKELAEGTSDDAFSAKLGLVLAKQKGLKTLASSQKHVDDALVELAGENTMIATQDKELKERVKAKGGKVVTLRQKKRLTLEG